MNEQEIAAQLREKVDEWNALISQAKDMGLYIYVSAEHYRSTPMEAPTLCIHKINKTTEY